METDKHMRDLTPQKMFLFVPHRRLIDRSPDNSSISDHAISDPEYDHKV